MSLLYARFYCHGNQIKGACKKYSCLTTYHQTLITWLRFKTLFVGKYSRVPNKRGGVRIIGGGGWKWFDITIIGGVGITGGRVGEIENSRFLSEQVSFTYLCEQ